VPAVAVIRDLLALSIITGCKTDVNGNTVCLIYKVVNFTIMVEYSVTPSRYKENTIRYGNVKIYEISRNINSEGNFLVSGDVVFRRHW